MFTLEKVTTRDDIVLNGLFSVGDSAKPVVIFIHGFNGTFYRPKFIPQIATILHKNNYGFLTVETRGNATVTQFHTSKPEVGKTIGSRFELLEEANLDIDAWADFLLQKGYKNIILAGHSLGTIKVVRHMKEGKYHSAIIKLILLAPFDEEAQIEKITKGRRREFVKHAEEMVEKGKGEELIPKNYELFQYSYQTYVSWYKPEGIFNMTDPKRSVPLWRDIDIPVKVIIGTRDDNFEMGCPKDPEEGMKNLSHQIKNFEYSLIEKATHGFAGYEEKVAEEVYNFAKK